MDALIAILAAAVALVLAGAKLIHCGHKHTDACRHDKGSHA